MYLYIEETALAMQEELCRLRMDFHRHPETAWNEIRTTREIEHYLSALGYETVTGELFSGRDTGIIGIMRCGEGPTVALRFDIDGLPVTECETISHIPYQKHFSSEYRGFMHACGHDGHTAIGLGCAKLLMSLKDHLHGTLKLLFQPAEEGARGAAPIVERGWLDDADYFLAAHIFNRPDTLPESCNIITGVSHSFATTKSDIIFHGKSAHAAHPEQGHDVIPVMAELVCRLKEIPGPGFIHIGTIQAGSGRNIIADYGKLELETRAPSTQRNIELNDSFMNILKSMTENSGVTCEIHITGSAPSVESTTEFADSLRKLYEQKLPSLHPAPDMVCFPASEDVSHMMNRVKENGGQASFLLLPARLSADLHHSDFDFPMTLLVTGVTAFASGAYHLLTGTK